MGWAYFAFFFNFFFFPTILFPYLFLSIFCSWSSYIFPIVRVFWCIFSLWLLYHCNSYVTQSDCSNRVSWSSISFPMDKCVSNPVHDYSIGVFPSFQCKEPKLQFSDNNFLIFPEFFSAFTTYISKKFAGKISTALLQIAFSKYSLINQASLLRLSR